MLVNSKKMLQDASNKGYALPSPDFFDTDSVKSYIKTAEKLNQPLILAFAQAHDDQLPLELAALIGKYYASIATVDICLHLDHGQDVNYIKKAIDLGFTSVMIDASKESFEKNVEITREIVDYAHKFNVTVEAEIGHVGSGVNYEKHENTDSIYTDVAEATKFVELTNVDSLAISIGTAHGVYKGIPEINFNQLIAIKNSVSVPLVLHGGSSSGFDNLQKCAENGISKINIFTDFLIGAMKNIDESEISDFLQLKNCAQIGMSQVLENYYNIFNLQNK